MHNQEFKNILKRIISEQFKGKARKYALAAGVNYNTLMNYLKRGSKPNPEILTKLAQAAGMSIAKLCGEAPEISKEVIAGMITGMIKHHIRRI